MTMRRVTGGIVMAAVFFCGCGCATRQDAIEAHCVLGPQMGLALASPAPGPDEAAWVDASPGRRAPAGEEAYDTVVDNPFLPAASEKLSTFSIDVDTASYSNVRRFLTQGQPPPKGAVRIEELVNYFHYDYPSPPAGQPLAVWAEAASCPWQSGNRLVRVGLKARDIPADRRPPTNLVFLLDVSGSMEAPNKLPLVKSAMKMLVEQLGENDRVAIVVYAGSSGVELPTTSGDQKAKILAALERLHAGGSTNGAGGIVQAYDVAVGGFIRGGVNRVILCTDGDFNVGVTSQGGLVELIESKARSGVSLTVLGFGMGNLKDSTLEKLADKGKGNYGYIDNLREARKIFVQQLSGTLVTVARDVKVQVEFNPHEVAAWRLIGYENRLMRAEDFHDDGKGAGEMGAGHTVTALYEVVPAASSNESNPGDLLTVRVRYKEAAGDAGKLIEQAVRDGGRKFEDAPADFRFAAAVAAFGMILRGSPYKAGATLGTVEDWAASARGADREGYRAEFLDLVRRAKADVPSAAWDAGKPADNPWKIGYPMGSTPAGA
jgi:Ca-activated chloride channel family protein